MEVRYFSSLSFGIVPSRIPSAKPAIVVIGVLSSWATFDMNSDLLSSAFSSESAIVLKDSIRTPISSSTSSALLTLTEKSPLAKRLEAAAISSSGFAICFE